MIEAVERGVRGYLPTSLSLEIVVAALRVVLVGGLYFPLPQRVRERQDSPERTPLQRMVGQNEADRIDLGAVQAVIPKLDVEATPSGFTPREAQVLAALRRGQSNKVIASDLNLSENTVKVHVRHIMRKLHATNRTQAVLYSQRRDL
jgi:DNA-binding NarL/FixJ family response regulator